MTTTKTFHYPFPAGPESAPYSAGRIEIPKGTTALRITGSVRFPEERPAGGLISLLGIRAGAQEGKRKLLSELTIGRRNQWRIAGDQTTPHQDGTARDISWGSDLPFRIEYGTGNKGKFVTIDTDQGVRTILAGQDLLDGGVLFVGMDSGGKGAEYVPLFGGVISGEITFYGAQEERPTDPLPPSGKTLALLRVHDKLEAILDEIKEELARPEK